MTTGMTHAYDWQGRTVLDRNGDKIGKVVSLYVDELTDRPEWALVNTGLFGTKSSFVPIAGASPQGEDVVVQVEAQQVKDAPKLDTEEGLSEQQEAELFRHYGIDYTDEGSVTATETPRAVRRPRRGRPRHQWADHGRGDDALGGGAQSRHDRA